MKEDKHRILYWQNCVKWIIVFWFLDDEQVALIKGCIKGTSIGRFVTKWILLFCGKYFYADKNAHSQTTFLRIQGRKDCQAVTFQSAARFLFTCLCNGSNLLYLTWCEGLWPKFASEASCVCIGCALARQWQDPAPVPQLAALTQPPLSTVQAGAPQMCFLCCRQGKGSAKGTGSASGVLLCKCIMWIPVWVLKVSGHEKTMI